ncbi:MAG: RluA family pseudouridine synthase [Candidatus Falkowbacteria bacterium]
MTQITTLISNQDKQRLDKFLTSNLTDFTRSQLQKLIERKLVKVNGAIRSAHFLVQTGDTVEIFPETIELVDGKTPKIILPKIKIIAETDDYLVINKPAGLLVHGGKHIKDISLVDWLIKYYPAVATVGDSPERPGIIHRLDKDVSGVMLIAKNQIAFDYYKSLFSQRLMHKKYTALVHGVIAKDEITLNFHIERSTSGYKMAARPSNQEGKEAISQVVTIKRWYHYSAANITILTGRTHQIRAHLSAYSHPIIGDELYGTRESKIKNKKLHTTRIYLAAIELGFTDQQGQPQLFIIKTPAEFQALSKTFS